MRAFSGLTALACGALLTVSVPATASAVTTPTCWGQPATVFGTTGDDTLTGTSGPDVIVGLAGNDTVSGLEGDDRLCGGKGADTLVGGDGDDHLSGGRDLVRDVTDDGDLITFGDDLDGGAGNDELDPGWQNGHHEFDGWVGDVIRFPGNEIGPQEGLRIDLGAGTAVGQGDDTLDLADVDMSVKVLGSPQGDVIRGTAHADWVDADGGDDHVLLGAGDDFVNDDGPGSGDDVYRGGRGSDILASGGGDDVVDGDRGNDVLSVAQRGTERTVSVLGGDGNDSVGFSDSGTGSPRGDYTYRGGRGNDGFGSQVEGRHAAPMHVDLAARRIDVGEDSAAFEGFEHLNLDSRHGAVDVAGTPGRDTLSITAKTASASLGNGPDDLRISDSGSADVQLGPGADRLRMFFVEHGVVAHLGAGDDLVASSDMHRAGLQRLFGGTGHDTARLFDVRSECHSIEQGSCPG